MQILVILIATSIILIITSVLWEVISIRCGCQWK